MKAIIFDLDGTLLNTLDDLANAANYMLRELCFKEHDIPSYRYRVGNGIPMLVSRSLPEGSSEATKALALSIFSARYSKHMLDCTHAYSGILPLLTELKSRGVQMAIATNKDQDLARSIALHYFGDSFSLVYGHTHGGKTKPDPEIVYTILRKLGAKREDIIYVGDSDVDMLTASNAGVFACGATWGFRSGDELTRSGAKALVTRPDELLQFL